MSEPKAVARVGVGGWTFDPWRETFYPEDLPRKRELHFASRRFSTIEINGTYYRSQKPETFAKWYEETPQDFVFSLKAPRFSTNRRVLAEGGESVERFIQSGVSELKEKLGPINWQFMATKTFDPEDFAAFLQLLPTAVDGRQIRHAVEVRHASFQNPEFVSLAREHNVAIIVAGDSGYPQIADPTASFVYARIMGSLATEAEGYAPCALDAWASRCRAWVAGERPEDLNLVHAEKAHPLPRDVFLYVISGYKPFNPAAACALLARLGTPL